MKKIVVISALYCILSCGVGVSRSFLFNLNKTVGKHPEAKASKYIYMIEREITTRAQLYNEALRTSASPSTGESIGNCNTSSVDESAFWRRRRSVRDWRSPATTASSHTVDLSILSQEFKDCTHTTVEPECYVQFPNGTVYVPLYNMFFDRSNYVINEDLLFVCPHFFDIMEEKFPTTIGIVSAVCVGISTVFIVLHILMFLLVEKLRNLPGYCLFSLCISLLIAYMNFFAHLKMSEYTECKVVGLIIMHSFLSSFFWMNVISFDVWHSIRLATSKLLLSSNRSMLLRFTLYSCYAWGTPLLILIVALIVEKTSGSVEYHLLFNQSTCWLRYKQALLVYFVLPLFFVLAMNTFFFVTSFRMITRSRSDSGSEESYDLRSRLFLSLRLGSAMGLMWVFGALDTLTQEVWISYLQSICNALQGVFIFFSFNFNKRTKNACKEVIKKKKSSILPTINSSLQ